MPSLALLKNVSFNIKNSDVKSYLSDKLTFHKFENTISLFHKIHELLGNGIIEILNCDYDEKYLIQAFYFENNDNDVYDNFLLVKRKINQNDNYVYTTESELLQNDIFEHHDVTHDDIEKLMLRKLYNCGVVVNENSELENMHYSVTYDHENHTGILNVTSNSNTYNFKFLNVPSLIKYHEKDDLEPEQFSKVLSDKVLETKSDFFYTQKDFGLGLLNCYCPIYGQSKNETMSKLMTEDSYGKCFIGLENHLNDDSRILPLNVETTNKILKFLSTSSTDFKQKNNVFCNVFYELDNF